jgi:hypothetical protein
LAEISNKADAMRKYHEISDVLVTSRQIALTIDGRRVFCPLKKVSPRLVAATADERKQFEISPSGYGLHWPRLDEDIAVDGLLRLMASSSRSATVYTSAPRQLLAVAEKPGRYGAVKKQALREH